MGNWLTISARTPGRGSHLVVKSFNITPWTMSATRLAAIAALPMVSLCKNKVRPIHVVILALNQRREFRRWGAAAHNRILPEARVKKDFGCPRSAKKTWD